MHGLLLIVNSAVGDLLNVRQLLREGADPNASDAGAWTSLHLAAAGGHAEVLRVLLARGADPAARNELGDTPLQVAIALDHVQAMDVLLQGSDRSSLPWVDCGRACGDGASLDAPSAD